MTKYRLPLYSASERRHIGIVGVFVIFLRQQMYYVLDFVVIFFSVPGEDRAAVFYYSVTLLVHLFRGQLFPALFFVFSKPHRLFGVEDGLAHNDRVISLLFNHRFFKSNFVDYLFLVIPPPVLDHAAF